MEYLIYIQMRLELKGKFEILLCSIHKDLYQKPHLSSLFLSDGDCLPG